MWFDLVLKGGRVLDGAGNPWFKADVGVKDGRISRVGRLNSANTSQIIDVEGLVVSPGFIDMHNHSDTTLLVEPRMKSKVMQGVTTEVNGNCGSSPAPVNENTLRLQRLRYLSEDDVIWTGMDGYFRRLEEQGVSQNVVTLVGHGTVRYHVMGDDWMRTSTLPELEEMKRLVADAMRDGAVGLSTGLTYAPGWYAETGEVIELAKVVAGFDGIYASHIREWGSKVLNWPDDLCTNLEGVAEAVEIGRESGVRAVQISHYNIRSEVVQDKDQYDNARRLFDSAREEGINVTADILPNEGGIGVLHEGAIPPRYLGEGVKKLLEYLCEPKTRAQIINDMKKKTPEELGFLHQSRKLIMLRNNKGECFRIFPPFNDHLINRDYEGKTLDEIAKEKEKDLFETFIDLILEEEGNIYVNIKTTDFNLLMKELTWVSTMVGTDGGSNEKVGANARQRARFPTGFGGFPRALAWVREEKVIPLEDMVRRMTSMPARTLGLKDRGLIKEGFWADITVFDQNTIDSMCTLKNDARPEYPIGISYLLINGELVVQNNDHTNKLPGKILRHPFNRF